MIKFPPRKGAFLPNCARKAPGFSHGLPTFDDIPSQEIANVLKNILKNKGIHYAKDVDDLFARLGGTAK